jgi:hypothetical protein
MLGVIAAARQPGDDRSIADTEELWRRVHPAQIVPDDNKGLRRPSSAAFSDPSDGTPMSICLSSLVIQSGRTPRDLLVGRQGTGLVGFRAHHVRELGLSVARDPLPEEPAHGIVVGIKTKQIQRRLARCAMWVVDPELRD